VRALRGGTRQYGQQLEVLMMGALELSSHSGDRVGHVALWTTMAGPGRPRGKRQPTVHHPERQMRSVSEIRKPLAAIRSRVT
jgi:hypothetical protein